MATIAVDVDSTLYDFETPSREAMYKMYKETGDDRYMHGAYMPWTEWRSPTDSLGLEKWLGVIAMVHDSEVIRRMTPFPGAVATCQALMEEGHHLLYISNRATEAQEATYDWLLDCGFLRADDDPAVDVLCTNENKAPYMAECQYLIDDRPKTVIEFVYSHDWAWRQNGVAEFQRKAFVKGYPYNQALTDIPNVYVAMDWYGINEYLVRKGVLSEAAAVPAL
jgi:phosphoglycolate phosphatase-like HAD superfamily hydrolase